MEKKSESSNIENASESDEKSSSSFIPGHSWEVPIQGSSIREIPEIPVEQTLSNSEDNDREMIIIHFVKVEPESSNIENFSDEKSSSPSTLKHDVPETYIEKASNPEAYDSKPSQSDITENQPESKNLEKNNESDEKSSSPSISKHDVSETSVEQALSNLENYVSQPSQPDITEEQPESTNVEKNNESDEKSSSPSISNHDVPGTSVEQALSNQEDYVSQPLQSDIMEEQSESTNVEKNNESDEKSSSPSIPSHDVPGTSVEQALSNQEDYVSKSPQTNITEKQPESINIEKNNESDEKSSSPSIPNHEVPGTSEQALSNQEDYVSKSPQTNITEKQPESTNIEINNESDEKLSSPSTPKHPEITFERFIHLEEYFRKFLQFYFMEKQPESSNIDDSSEFKILSIPKNPKITITDLHSNVTQSSQECIQKNKSDNKSKENQDERGLSASDSYCTVNEQPSTSNFIINLLPNLHFNVTQSSQECIQKNKSDNKSKENQDERGLSASDSYATVNEQPSTSKSALELKSSSLQGCNQKKESDTKSTDNQYKKEEKHRSNVEIKFKIKSSTESSPTEPSEDGQVRNMETEKSKDLTENVHDNILDYISPASESTDNQAEITSDKEFENAVDPTSITENNNQSLETSSIVKDIPPKPRTTGEAQKDEKPKKLRIIKIKARRKYLSKDCFSCLLNFMISFILILSPCIITYLLQFYFCGRILISVRIIKNYEHADTFATTVVELEKAILNHDATIRVLTEYLERDTPLLKVVALIGDTSVDKTYTVDIIKKRLRKKRSSNGSLPSLPRFVVLENLRAEQSTVVMDYIKTYQEAYDNREFIILAVYKVEQFGDDLTRGDINHVINTVKDFFINANISMKIIPFKPLSEDALEKYIINTAENIGLTLSQDEIDYNKRLLIEDFNDCQKGHNCYKSHT